MGGGAKVADLACWHCGYLAPRHLLKREDLMADRKGIYQTRSELGLQVRIARRKTP